MKKSNNVSNTLKIISLRQRSFYAEPKDESSPSSRFSLELAELKSRPGSNSSNDCHAGCILSSVIFSAQMQQSELEMTTKEGVASSLLLSGQHL